MTTLAGLAGPSGNGDDGSGYADGNGASARFRSPKGVAVDAGGNLYVADSGNNRIRKIVPSPQLALEQPAGTSIQNNANISMGEAIVGGNVTKTFTIKNTGTAPLTGLYINQYGWDIQAGLLPSDTLAPGGNMTFTVTYTPYWGGQSSSTLEIYSNDPSTNPFTINLTGNGLAWWMDSDGDGMNDAEEYQLRDKGFDWQVSQPAFVQAYRIAPTFELPSIVSSKKSLLQELTATGGTGPFVWQVSSGSLPSGVSLSQNGTLTGTPSLPGNYQFTLRVTNSEGFSAERTVRFRVVPPSTFGGGYNFANFAGSLFGFTGSADAAFAGSGAGSGGFTGSADGRTSFTGSADASSRKPLLYAPSGVAVDATGNIYVTDSANHQIRKIAANGSIQNFAGTFTGSGGQDGLKWNARFSNPQGLDSDASGNIYVADQDNHAIRKISSSGSVSTLAGSFTGSGAAGFSGSADGGAKTTARFNKPSDVAVDAAGNIYVADSGNHAIRKISTNGTVTTLAGTMGAAGNTNAAGANARFRTPQGIAVDGNGTVYVADTGNQVIRRIASNGSVKTFAGAAFTGSASPLGGRASFTGSAHAAFIGSADSTNLPASVDGSATTARFSYPTDITIDSAGNLYVTDSGTDKIRKITANGTVTTLGGSPAGFFYNPLAIASGSNGTLYVADAGNNRIARGIPGSAAIEPPTILTQPSSQLVYNGTPVSFAVTSSGSNPTYQWYRNGTAVAGANNPTLNLTASTGTKGSYTLVVSNVLGSETSDAAALTLRPAAEWTWMNAAPTTPALPGDTVVLSVDNVTGPGNIGYQWLKNGRAIPGKNSPTLTLGNVGIADSGVYSLAITTSAGRIVTEGQALCIEDTGTLVYKIRAIGSSAEGATRSSSRLEGYLVRDRSNGSSCFLWTDSMRKTWKLEWMPDLTMKSTGPLLGSTSVLRAYLEQQDDEESIWFSGIDNLVRVGSGTEVLAPAKLEGHMHTITNESGTVVEMLKATLTLDPAQTLKAITVDNGIGFTLNRITSELEAKGYRLDE